MPFYPPLCIIMHNLKVQQQRKCIFRWTYLWTCRAFKIPKLHIQPI